MTTEAELKTRKITDVEVGAFNRQVPDEVSDFLGFTKGELVYDGPLRVDAMPSEDAVVVIGDFVCKGVLEVREDQRLVVTGRLEAKGIIAYGLVLVLGDVSTGDVLGDSMSNLVFCCGGDARVRCLIERGHQFEFEGALDASFVAVLRNVVRIAGQNVDALKKGEAEKRLVAEIFDEDGLVKSDLVAQRIWKGQALLR